MAGLDQVSVDKIRLWREHPAAMVRDLFGAIPDPYQEEALEAYPYCPRLAMKAAKGPGKTTTLSWIGWNFLLTRESPKIAATSISGDNLKDGLWAEMAKWQQKSDLLTALFDWNQQRITYKPSPETWFMSARRWSASADSEKQADALAGLHADYILFLLDESGSIPMPVMVTADAALSSGIEAHVVQAGNPTMLEGPLYAACTSQRHLWKLIEITGDPDRADRAARINLQWAREMVQVHGRDNPWVRINVLGEFPLSNINSLIGPDEANACMKRYYRESDIGHVATILGVDVARYGDDKSVIRPRRGIQVLPKTELRNVDSILGAGTVARIWNDKNADAAFLDVTGGYGGGWQDQLIQLGRAPIGIQFSQQAHQPERFTNKRMEMYWDAAEWMKGGGALPEDAAEIVAAMTRTTYTYWRDRMLLEPKDMIKIKLGYSPDDADAFCFVGGTLVETPSGPVAIETIRPGDEVLTPFGVSKVAVNWITNAGRLSTVTLTNGATLKGRPEHDVFVYGHGKVPLDALSLTMDLSPLSERWKWVSASALFTEARSIGFKTLVGISPRANLFTASACCIGAYGLSVMGQFQKATRSITKIVTGGTAKSTILNSYPQMNTPNFTAPNAALTPKTSASSTSKLHARQQRHGTPLQRELSGIASTVSTCGKTGSRSAAFAYGAEPHSGRWCQVELDSAQRVASRPMPTSAMRQMFAHAIGAGARLLRTVTGTQRVAPVSVQTESVLPTLVYNLTLERDNAYYANGILVFNCLTFAEPVSPKQTIVGPTRHSVDWDYAKALGDDPLGNLVRQSYDPFGDNRN